MNDTIWGLFNSVNVVPDHTMQTLFKDYCEGIDFQSFVNNCWEVADKYNINGDYLSSYIIDLYEELTNTK